MFFDSVKWQNCANANNYKPFQQCALTVMDTISDSKITFDKNGISNYFHEYNETAKSLLSVQKGKENLIDLVKEIKENGAGKNYDVILGVSGGVDSSYLAVLAKELGLRALLVHFDNGWNSELAVKNIENLVSHLGFDLFTLVVDWQEFRDLQLSYIKANVVDIEALTDHAISGTLVKLAKKEKVNYILSGNNIVTEAILPSDWIFNKSDHINILSIHKQFGTVPLKTFPIFSYYKRKLLNRKIKFVELLNLVEYNKREVKEVLKKEINWIDYGGKHFESVFTRFYQGFILPNKFGIDKRKAHLSTLICSGQITREEALAELQKEIYPDNLLEEDRIFVLKKLGLSEEQFKEYISKGKRNHRDFDYFKGLGGTFPILQRIKQILSKLKII
jgi:N-acetyl sugar amidotransferase